MINTKLLRDTLLHIALRPEEWDQDHWVCGTSACFAGHAVALSGIELAFDDDAIGPWKIPTKLADRMGLGPGDWSNVNHVAAALIGIEPYPDRFSERDGAGHLFSPKNSLTDLRRIVDELCTSAEVNA